MTNSSQPSDHAEQIRKQIEDGKFDNVPEGRYTVTPHGRFRTQIKDADIEEGEGLTVVVSQDGEQKRIQGVLKTWYSEKKLLLDPENQGDNIVVTEDESRRLNEGVTEGRTMWVEYKPVDATSAMNARSDGGEIKTTGLDLGEALNNV